eukprot:2887110-Rhodomonas_salina.1
MPGACADHARCMNQRRAVHEPAVTVFRLLCMPLDGSSACIVAAQSRVQRSAVAQSWVQRFEARAWREKVAHQYLEGAQTSNPQHLTGATLARVRCQRTLASA